MSKLLYSAAMSLDGFIAGPEGDMSWMTRHVGGRNPLAKDLPGMIGALLIGNRTQIGDDPNAGTEKEGPFGGAWSGQSIVLTHHVDGREPSDDTTYVDDFDTAVAMAKEAAGELYVSILGANVAKQCLEKDLLDEVLVFILPVLLGDGTRLFESEGGAEVLLEPLDRPNPGGPPTLWYRVA